MKEKAIRDEREIALIGHASALTGMQRLPRDRQTPFVREAQGFAAENHDDGSTLSFSPSPSGKTVQ